MIKKLLLSTLITVLLTGVTIGSVSAESIESGHEHVNEIGVTVSPGDLTFVMTDTDLTFNWELNSDGPGTLQAEDGGGILEYTVTDYRGLDDGVTVTHDLSAFVLDHDGEEVTLTPDGALVLDTKSFTPSEGVLEMTNALDLSEITFTDSGFIKPGIYNATLTTTIGSVATP